MVGVLQQRYGLSRREDADGAKDAETASAEHPATFDPEQVGFAW